MWALTGCGGGNGDTPGGSGAGSQPQAEAGPVHVHGLGIDPQDGSLLIATHTGLFRAPRGEVKATRVGAGEQDTMGFTVIGANRFLGSGHPGQGQSGPPMLGLIQSTDGGQTWKSRSLLGEADFHVLRSSPPRIYGFDATKGRLMVSDDDGRSWEQTSRPGQLIDLAVDPASKDRVVASSPSGLFVSEHAGRKWTAVGTRVGLLAWPTHDRLYLVDGQGQVQVSPNGGRNWKRLGSIGGQPAAFISNGPRELYAARGDAVVMRSTNEGRNWAVRSRP